MYQVELVWNREFNFIPYGPTHDLLEEAIKYAKQLEEMGNGERVKKTRIIDDEGAVRWMNGRVIR